MREDIKNMEEDQNFEDDFVEDDEEEVEVYDDVDEFEANFIGPVEEDEVEIPDMSEKCLIKHTRSVFCGSFNSDASLAITGSEDDASYVWNVETGEIVFECSGHKDSVISAKFSCNDKFAVTADMGGMAQVWSVPNKKLEWAFEGDDILWCHWHPTTSVVLSGNQTGDIYMWQMPQGNCKVLPTNGSECNCGVVLPDGLNLVAGYQNGIIRVWDLKKTEVVCQSTQLAQITNIDVNHDGSLAITSGSTSSHIVKTTDCKTVGTLNAVEGQIEAAAFCKEPDLPIAATGTLDGYVTLWDVSRATQRSQYHLGEGVSVTTLCWGAGCVLYAGGTDGCVYVLDGRSGTLRDSLTGHAYTILDMTLSRDSSRLLTTSDDYTARVFDVRKYASSIQ